MMTATPYLNPHQTIARAPTSYEDLFATSLEQAFGAGVEDLAGLAAALDQSGPAHPSQAPWSADLLARELSRLAEI